MGRILFLSEGRDAPSTRYRAAAFLPALEQAGWHGTLHDLTDLPSRTRALSLARSHDVTVVLRKTLGQPFRWLLRQAARRLVLDIDDAVWVRDDGTPSATRRARFVRMASAVDAVWAGNQYLADEAARFARRVTVLPTSVQVPEACPPPAPWVAGQPVDVVWIGSSSTRKYLESLLPALRAAHQHEPRLRLKIISDFSLPDAGLPTLVVPWSSAVEDAALRASHLGLAPMREDAWTRGKCGLKVLQCMAAALPVLASPHGVHVTLVEPGRTGWLPRDEAEWTQRLVDMVRNPTDGATMGAAGWARAKEHFSVPVTAAKMIAALADLMQG